jgi:hypothetical protein
MSPPEGEREIYQLIGYGIFFGILLIGALLLAGCATPTDEPTVPSTTASAPTAATPRPLPLADYVGPGTFRIGSQMTPGVWVTPGATGAICSYWIRTAPGGTVVEQDSTGPGEALLVQLDRDDDEQQIFESSGCEPWREVSP